MTAATGSALGRTHSYQCWGWHDECALRAAHDLAVTRRDHATAAARRFRAALAAHQHSDANPTPDDQPLGATFDVLQDARDLLAAQHRAAQRRTRGSGAQRQEAC